MTTFFQTANKGTDAPYRVGIQGFPGAFHHLAADAFFTDHAYEVISFRNFLPLAKSLAEGSEVDVGLMAIENSLVGSLLPNYHLLIQYGLKIRGEIYLRIRHNLLALKGQSVEELSEVHSHPMAIEQCRPFFSDYPHIRLVESEDTAMSAERISRLQRSGIGAIGSTLAGELYGLEILNAGIESNHQNYTRFLVVSNAGIHDLEKERGVKVSISITLSHDVGSLASVLQSMAAMNLNLIKIQSVPIQGTPWRYRFFLDFVQPAESSLEETVFGIQGLAEEFQLLGVYAAGKHIQ